MSEIIAFGGTSPIRRQTGSSLSRHRRDPRPSVAGQATKEKILISFADRDFYCLIRLSYIQLVEIIMEYQYLNLASFETENREN